LLAYAVVGMAEGGTRFWVEKSRREAAGVPTDRGNAFRVADDVRLLSQRISTIAWAGLRGVQPD
jgi:hypothetical protein